MAAAVDLLTGYRPVGGQLVVTESRRYLANLPNYSHFLALCAAMTDWERVMMKTISTCRLVARRALIGLAAVTSLVASVDIAVAQSEALKIDADDRAAIEAIVREYILEHPEIITEALDLLQQREEMAELERQRAALVAQHDAIFNSQSPVMGNPNGDVTLVEFFDYQCGFCKRVLDDVFAVAEDDPGLRVIFKDLPILGPASTVAARASLAARNQGLYSEYHNALMGHRGQLSEALIFDIAADVGLDVDRLRRDMDAPEIRDELNANIRLAQQLGIRGTPAFVIGDEVVPGARSLQEIEAFIERARAS